MVTSFEAHKIKVIRLAQALLSEIAPSDYWGIMARQCEEDDFFSIENEVVFVEETEEIGVVSFPSIFSSL